MTITDEELARRFATATGVIWDHTHAQARHDYIAMARTARRLLCPPSEEELRLERGKAACNAIVPTSRDLWTGPAWDKISQVAQEDWCIVADAVLAKKAEQDREASDGS